MMRRLAAPTVLGVALVVALANVAFAATNVSMTNYQFTPSTVNIALGGKVTWTNNQNTPATPHTTTSDGINDGSGLKGIGLWKSGTVQPGSSFSFTFTAAGTYPFHCSFHYSLGMKGVVRVPVKVSPGSAALGTAFTITWATKSASGPFVYDVQRKAPGGTFQSWKTGVTGGSTSFTPKMKGTWSFRARLRNTNKNAASKYSPAASIDVT